MQMHSFDQRPHSLSVDRGSEQNVTLVYLQQLMLSQKALHHALHCPLYSTFGVKTLHIHSC